MRACNRQNWRRRRAPARAPVLWRQTPWMTATSRCLAPLALPVCLAPRAVVHAWPCYQAVVHAWPCKAVECLALQGCTVCLALAGCCVCLAPLALLGCSVCLAPVVLPDCSVCLAPVVLPGCNVCLGPLHAEYVHNNTNKRPLTPKCMPPTGDEHAKP